MKNLLNMTLVTLAIAFTPMTLFAKEGGGGPGGSGKVGEGQNSLPADFFAELNGPVFPRKNETPISLEKDYPELYAEVQRIFKILRKRNRNTDPWLHKLSEYKIYVVNQLSTDADVVKMKDNLKLIPTAVTYNFSELNSSGRTTNEYRVIELNRETFFNRNLRFQALDIIHEMAHHEKHEPRASDHQFISPFITGLNALLDVIERQEEQDYSLTDGEYEKIVTMQNMIENIFGKYGFNKDYEFYVYRNGGGVLEIRTTDRDFYNKGKSVSEQATQLLEAQDKKLRANENIVDALSTVQFEISIHKSGYSFFGNHNILDRMPKDSISLDHVKNNKILNSMIHFGIWDKSCAGNTFKNIQRPTVFEKNIPEDDKDYKKPDSMYSSHRPPEWKFKKIYYVDCQGDNNTIRDIMADQHLTVAGNGNLVEKIGTSISVSIKGNSNALSNIKLPELIRSKYSIADEYGNLFNYTLVRVEGDNNQVVNSEPMRQISLRNVSNSRIADVNGIFIEISDSTNVYISNFVIEGRDWCGLCTGLSLEQTKTALNKVTPSLEIVDSRDVAIEKVKVQLGNQSEWTAQKTGNIYSTAESVHFKISKSSFQAKNLVIDNSPIKTPDKYEQGSPIGYAILNASFSMENGTVRLQDLCAQKSVTREMECKDMKAFTSRSIRDEKY